MPWWIVPTVLLVALALLSVRARRAGEAGGAKPFARTGTHYRRLYSRRNFLRLAGGVAAGAAMAYSGADEAIEEWHARDVKGDASDALSHYLHEYGERFWFGYWAIFALADAFVASTPLSRSGRRAFESMVAGLPMLWGTQRLLGAARPSDQTHGARYLPFADDNSASGHAFIAATPLMAAIGEFESKPVRAVLGACVPWVGWSRLNDRKHYPGQILLGLWISYLAVDATGEERPPA